MNKGFEFGGISGNNTAIKPHIHPTLTLCRLDLLLKGSDSGGGRDGVQRHVKDGSDASKGGRLGAGIEALPFSAARFIKMDMSIDQAGEQNVWRIVGIGRPHGELSRWDDRVEHGGDLAGATRDDYGGGSQTTGDDGARRGHDGDGIHSGGHDGKYEVGIGMKQRAKDGKEKTDATQKDKRGEGLSRVARLIYVCLPSLSPLNYSMQMCNLFLKLWNPDYSIKTSAIIQPITASESELGRYMYT